MPGPLEGVRVIEVAGLGAAPFAGMVMADFGADVVRVDRADRVGAVGADAARFDVLNRGKRSIGIDLKSEMGADVLVRLASTADALIEGFRPGVMERLGIGPERLLEANPRLVYGRMTGWGQDGPLAAMAGHDIDYIGVSGVLHAIGGSGGPVPPLNLVGDFGGGGLVLALGVVAAVLQARQTEKGQIVDAAMVDGSALLSAATHGYMAEGWWVDDRDSNLLDGAAPFYTVYETSDGKHVAVGALEPQFFAELVDGLGLDPAALPPQMDREGWPRMKEAFATRFRERTRDEWDEHFRGTDACVAPVLSMLEAPAHPHNTARANFVEVSGVVQPGIAPRFSGSTRAVPGAPVPAGANTDSVLEELGYTPDQIGMLRRSGAVA